MNYLFRASLPLSHILCAPATLYHTIHGGVAPRTVYYTPRAPRTVYYAPRAPHMHCLTHTPSCQQLTAGPCIVYPPYPTGTHTLLHKYTSYSHKYPPRTAAAALACMRMAYTHPAQPCSPHSSHTCLHSMPLHIMLPHMPAQHAPPYHAATCACTACPSISCCHMCLHSMPLHIMLPHVPAQHAPPYHAATCACTACPPPKSISCSVCDMQCVSTPSRYPVRVPHMLHTLAVSRSCASEIGSQFVFGHLPVKC